MRVHWKTVVTLISTALFAAPAFAQTGYGSFYGGRGRTSSFNVFAVRSTFKNSSTNPFGGTTATGPIESNFRSANGLGIGYTGFVGSNFALDFAASYIHPNVNYTTTVGATPINGGRVRLIPVTGTAQWHFIPAGGIDPYLGGGVAYVNMRSNASFNTNTGLTSVNYGSEWGPAFQGGVLIGFRSFGIDLDAKYLPLRARGTGAFATATGPFTGTRGSMRINPLLLSAGVTF